MNSRQRVLSTFRFEPVDRPAYDLMEGCVWQELLEYFKLHQDLETPEQVIEYLDPDFRWAFLKYDGPPPEEVSTASLEEEAPTYTKAVVEGPLAQAETTADIENHPWPDTSCLVPDDYEQFRRKWQDKALVFCPGWMPLFWTACELFGMESAMINMVSHAELFECLIQKQHALCMDILTRSAPFAKGNCDLALLGDDFAHQQNMLISPKLWKRYIKPYLAEQVNLLKQNDMLVLFHSCGAVRPILNDLLEIGVNGLLVFQTSAKGMDAKSIANEFGGRMVFYGGIDVQSVLSNGSVDAVKAEVESNIHAFADKGGYIVANSHHTVSTIKGENIIAMCDTARSTLFSSGVSFH